MKDKNEENSSRSIGFAIKSDSDKRIKKIDSGGSNEGDKGNTRQCHYPTFVGEGQTHSLAMMG